MAQSTIQSAGSAPYRVWSFVSEYSLLLIFGAIAALVWANLDYHSYHHFVEYPLLFNDWVGTSADTWVKKAGAEFAHHFEVSGARVLSVHYVINDMLMALFFAIAGKEVWEAVALKNGSLRGKKALTPLIATSGGMLGPIAVYLAAAYLLRDFTMLANGWAIPTATDIAFSYLIGRLVFGAGHPAVRFLLLLAIADDAAGLIILAVFFPQDDLAPAWLLVSLGAAVAVYLLANYLPRRMGTGPWVWKTFGALPYVIAGVVSWYAFTQAGIHPALGLLPIIPAIPHQDVALGFFAADEADQTDPLNVMEHALKAPVEVVLLLFGLANAGVALTSMNSATWAVLAGLLIGKPLGIWLMGVLAADGLKLGLPEGMKNSDLLVLGCVAAIGFTVSLFMATVAFPAGTVSPEVLEGAKMGALLSFAAAALAFAVSRMMGVRKVEL
ncbi:MAG: Na+/H+ antiporter NhaA [Pseudomonadota bacterium]